MTPSAASWIASSPRGGDFIRLRTCRNPNVRYFVAMKFLTDREQLVLALIVLAFATGAGVRQWRAMQGMPTAIAFEELRQP